MSAPGMVASNTQESRNMLYLSCNGTVPLAELASEDLGLRLLHCPG
jgi:hypothetical protein